MIYPSARLDVVETDVTTKIEEGIKNISGITETKTYSIENASIVILDFEFDTNLNEKMNEIKDALSKIKLPTNCEEPTISMVDFNASAVVNIFLDNAAINKINEIQD
ncbi:MAG: efflux RND transporter permease subunit [Bacilli bacterium]